MDYRQIVPFEKMLLDEKKAFLQVITYRKAHSLFN